MALKYYYMDELAEHWAYLGDMLDENYASDLKNVSIIVGACVKYSVDYFRKLINDDSIKIIVYQLEPLLESHWFSTSKIISNLKGADEVWDYDLDNIKVLKENGINAKFKPILYTDSLNKIENYSNPTIDVLFFGSPTIKRYKTLYDPFIANVIPEEIFDIISHTSIVNVYNVWGNNELTDYIRNSKIVLNMNPHDGKSIQQQTRISYLLNNNKCVLSEKSNRNYYGDIIYEFSSPNEMLSNIANILKNELWKSCQFLEKFKQYSKNSLLKYESK